MYKIYRGVIKKIPTDEQFEKSLKKELDLATLTLRDTIRVKEIKNHSEILEYIPFRISYQEVDYRGQEKYTLNEATNEYEKVYRLSPVISAYSKEMRILSEMEEYTPVKVVVEERRDKERVYHKLICLQDQTKGKLS